MDIKRLIDKLKGKEEPEEETVAYKETKEEIKLDNYNCL